MTASPDMVNVPTLFKAFFCFFLILIQLWFCFCRGIESTGCQRLFKVFLVFAFCRRFLFVLLAQPPQHNRIVLGVSGVRRGNMTPVHLPTLLFTTLLLASFSRVVVSSSAAAFLSSPPAASAARRKGAPTTPRHRRTLDLGLSLEYDDFLPQPNPSLEPCDVLSACMATLHSRRDAGLEVCFNFSSDRCRAAIGGSLEKFAEYATNPVFGYLVKCGDYGVINVGPEITGTPTRGAMQTILMDARQSEDAVDEFSRRFLWTFQKERRPPRQNCWVIHEVIYVKNAYLLTV
jgi:hypothetical protein